MREELRRVRGGVIGCLTPKEIVEEASKKTYLKTVQQKNTKKNVLSSGKSTIKERKTNTTRLLIYSIVFVVVALIGYLICNPNLFNRGSINQPQKGNVK